MKEKILLVLDLDETLIHACTKSEYPNWEFQLEKYKVFVRPGLPEFLELIKLYFEVAVWSSASDEYVKEVVNRIFPHDYGLKFVWGRSRCSFQPKRQDKNRHFDPFTDFHPVKRLKKVKQQGIKALEKILIIDDSPVKSQQNYGNAIHPSKFKGDPGDRELKDLATYLLTLNEVENVREIEKRYWKQR